MEKIGNSISQIIKKNVGKNNSGLALHIIKAFTQIYINEKEELGNIATTISQIIKENAGNNNSGLAFWIIDGFVAGFLKKINNLESLFNEISKIIEDNPKSASKAISIFTQEFIYNKEKNLKPINYYISKIIKNLGKKNNPDLVFDIIDGFVKGYLLQTPDDIKNLTDEISKIIKENPEFAFRISDGFTHGCIVILPKLKDIGKCIYNILNDEEIKGDSDLVSHIIDTFVQDCLKLRPYTAKEDIAEIFSKLLDIDFGTNETKIKSRLKSTLSSIENQHRTNTFTNSSNKQLSKEYEKQTETQLLNRHNKLLDERNNGKITNSCYDSPQPPYPPTNSSKNEKGITRESSTKAKQEKTKDLYAKRNKSLEPERKEKSSNKKQEYNPISNSAKLRLRQKKQQYYRSRY